LAEEMNHTFHYATPEEIGQWAALAKPLHEEYMTQNAGAGPIRDVYDRLQQLIKEY
jgi:hypothetical protein